MTYSRRTRAVSAGRRRRLLAASLAVSLLASCASLPTVPSPPLPPEGAVPSWERVAEGIGYARLGLESPPLQLHALRIDLDAPGVEVVVTPGSGKLGRTRGRTLSSFAAAFDCAVAVNGGPFSPSFAVAGESMTLAGLAVSKGRLVSAPDPRYAALVFPVSGGARVVEQSATLDLGQLYDAVGGFFVVLESGRVVGRGGKREPRTAAGVSGNGRILYLLVADGRRRESVGLSEAETGAWLASLGAVDGLCLDGGGSSAMCLRRAGAATRVVNVPMHGGLPGWQRVLGDCLGFRAQP